MRTSEGVVEVYELVKTHADTPPSWTRVRKERSITTSGEGMWHYTAGDWASQMKNRAEYAIRHRGKTRVTLFISGAKGSGKTLFVEWLAGELCLPLYNVDLSSPHVTNEVLRESVTPNRLIHNLPVIFHFDEFQSMIGEWCQDPAKAQAKTSKSNVTIQGLQCMLEGTSTPNNAIFVFTSSQALPDFTGATEDVQHEWRGLLRRFPVQVHIPMMSANERKDYCQQFLAAYLTDPWVSTHPKEMKRWCAFEEVWDLRRRGVHFDMFSKYLQDRTQAAYIRGLMTSCPEGCKVRQECRDMYLDALFDTGEVQRWMTSYAGNIM